MSFENVKLIFSSHPPDRLSKMKADFDHWLCNVEVAGSFSTSRFTDWWGWKVDCSGFKKGREEQGDRKERELYWAVFFVCLFGLTLDS